ncbi:MAG: molybdopterin-guanine dinucleotide biosynthesis protein B [Chloroflexi bacterium 44-23]|nr:MAG: molybdopterin-guanine dinucleotide biosynthesis protein B [Chloroflexi bacterium 44-23]
MKQSRIPLVTFVGRSGSGKTTLLEKLIKELSGRGYRLATVKHHSHAGFDIDAAGKDSWRFAQAGSQQVVIASPDKFATYWKLDHELDLDEVIAQVTDVDLILVEGYRSSNKPSLEVVRSATGLELVGMSEYRIALISDVQMSIGVPCFNINDIQGIADFIEEQFLKMVF